MATVSLITTSLDFGDLPVNETRVLPVSIAVSGGNASFLISQITAPYSVLIPSLAGGAGPVVRVWVAVKGTSAGATLTGTVTIQVFGGQNLPAVPVTVRIVGPRPHAVSLVLDQSGSMAETSGLGISRMDLLKQAAPKLVNLLRPTDEVGVIGFSSTATPLATLATDGQSAALTAITALTPGGNTSIGAGVQRAATELAGSASTRKATVVFTDGAENTAPMLADPAVAGLINSGVYAIGAGTAAQLNPVALQQLCANTNGYLAITGPIQNPNDFRLDKYFLQVLAGVTNAEIITDPARWLDPGQTWELPFAVADTDSEFTAIVLCRGQKELDLTLITPEGKEVSWGFGVTGLDQVLTDDMAAIRVALPVPELDDAHAGTWVARVYRRGGYTISSDPTSEDATGFQTSRSTASSHLAAGLRDGTSTDGHPNGLLVDISVQAVSALGMTVRLAPQDLRPPTTVDLEVLLTFAGVPRPFEAVVNVDVLWPDGITETLTVADQANGSYTGSFRARIAGSYEVVVTAAGLTEERGTEAGTVGRQPFTRYARRTVQVWYPPNPDPAGGGGGGGCGCCCGGGGCGCCGGGGAVVDLLRCLLRRGSIQEWLHRQQIDPAEVATCLAKVANRRTVEDR